MPQSVMWKELTAADLRAKAQAGAIVLLPVASMEQHGPHLPVGVDTFLSEGVCKAAAEAIAAETPVVVAPTLWCGMAEHHMAFGGTFTLDIPTYRAVLLCLLKSLERHGFKRVLIVNGHGGNIAALGSLPARLRPRDRPGAARHHLLRAGAEGRSRQILEDQERRASRLRGRDLDDDGGGARHGAARQARRGARAAALDAAAGGRCALRLVPRRHRRPA